MQLHYDVDGNDFLRAGEASANVKRILKQLGISAQIIRKVAIAMYEAEMNMVIHGKGGHIQVNLISEYIEIILKDDGPGIPDITLAMKEGYSTAPAHIRELGFGAGMGLPNIKRYSDELDIISNCGEGTTVRIKVLLIPK